MGLSKLASYPNLKSTLLLGAIFLSPLVAAAQQDQSSSRPDTTTTQTPKDQKDPTAQSASQGSDGTPIPAVLVNSDVPQIRSIGRASLLEPTQLHWGDFYVGSADFSQVYSTINPKTGAPVADNASLFRVHLFFDHQFKRARLVFQYQPRAMVLNGKFVSDFLNQDVNVDTYFVLSSRWVMGLGEKLTYYQSKNAFGQSFLDVDSITATTVQNNFLEGAGSWLSSTTGASFNYLWSRRTKFSVAPSFTYSRSDIVIGAAGTPTPPTDEIQASNAYSLRASVSYDQTATRTLGAYYHINYLTSPSLFANTVYHEFGASVSQRFTPSLSASASAGATTASFAGGRQWDAALSLSVVKTFQHSSFGLSYTRGEALSGYVTNNLGERIDARVIHAWTRRFQTGIGAGYEREITKPTGLWAKYAGVKASYRLTSQLNLYSNYVHKWQKATTPQLFSGGSDFVLVGIGWTPGRTNEIQ